MPSNNCVFNYAEPPGDRCSVCFSRQGPFALETRPTGPNFSLQAWPLCSACWSMTHGQPSDPDPGRLEATAGGGPR